MPRVVWNLSYPIATPDQLAVFRHHFETLRLDSHVADITATERGDVPNVMTMRVEFTDGHDRPDSQELRFADSMYPSRMRHLEQDIQVSGTLEQAEETLRRLRFELPRIQGMSPQDVRDRMREVVEALRVPDMMGLVHALGPGVPGFTPPLSIPKWIAVGRAYRQKAGKRLLVTLLRVRVGPGQVVCETVGDGEVHLEYLLAEFADIFEPYERPALPPTAWTRILEDDSED